MAIQFKPLSNDLYSIPKAQILFKPDGADAFELLGDSDEVTIEPTVEETERFTNEAGIRLLAKTIVTQVDANLNMTLVQLSDRNRALSLLGELAYDTQPATLAHNQSLVAPDHADKIYKLDHEDIDPGSVTVTDGTTLVAYTLDVDYKIDTEAGFIQLINLPLGADGDVEITYDAVAIVTADGRAKFGIASKTENRGTVIIRGTNEVGPRVMIQLHDVQLRPSAARNYVSETDLDTIEVVGRVFRDDSQPAGFELGFERTLNAIP